MSSVSLIFSLGGRLSLCASMIRPDSMLADIGTDHAYLPVWLAKQGKIRRAVAADVRPGPLERARQNIERYGVQNIVCARLSDGLDAVHPDEADDIVMAGMGGQLIARIISRTLWLESPSKHLILQPMTSVVDLRLFLCRQGFTVRKEQAVIEDGHVYTVMLCVYDPSGRAKGETYPYTGLLKPDTEANRMFLLREMKRLQNRAMGLKAEGDVDTAEKLLRIRRRIEKMFPKN